MLAREFAAVLGELPEHLPLSDRLERLDKQASRRWWFSQRTHLVGYICRKAHGEKGEDWDKAEVPQVWSGITRPEARLWVIEALGMIGSEGHKIVSTLLNLPHGEKRAKYQAQRDYLEERYPLEEIVKAAQVIYDRLELADNQRYQD